MSRQVAVPLVTGFLLAVLIFVGRTAIRSGLVIELLGGVPVSRSTELVVGFDIPVAAAFDQIYEATESGVVSATLNYAARDRGLICGFVGQTRESLHPENRPNSAFMLGAASIQCSGGCSPAGVYIPYAALSMPVSAGQFWIVTNCSGGGGDARVYFSQLTLTTPSPE